MNLNTLSIPTDLIRNPSLSTATRVVLALAATPGLTAAELADFLATPEKKVVQARGQAYRRGLLGKAPTGVGNTSAWSYQPCDQGQG